MKYYLIAGEASGDLHGSNLIFAIKKLDSKAMVRAWGGDKMRDAGAEMVRHIRDLAFMGFSEVLKNLPAILRNLRFCKEDIAAFQPDVLILIDYPGFNLRIAKWARKQNLKIVYYISPQIWAWKESRIRQIRRNVDQMIVIFPFEKTFYNHRNYEVEYVGHPLVPVIDDFIAHHDIPRDDKLVVLLPGSRKQEINMKLPIMLQATQSFPDLHFYIARSPALDSEFYTNFLKGYDNITLEENTYPLLMKAKAAMVASGTATLETALFNVPQVVCYKTSRISYAIGRMLVRLKFICIVNLIMDKEVVKELIQEQLTAENIRDELTKLLFDPQKRERILEDYRQLRILLSSQGNASAKAAATIVKLAEAT